MPEQKEKHTMSNTTAHIHDSSHRPRPCGDCSVCLDDPAHDGDCSGPAVCNYQYCRVGSTEHYASDACDPAEHRHEDDCNDPTCGLHNDEELSDTAFDVADDDGDPHDQLHPLSRHYDALQKEHPTLDLLRTPRDPASIDLSPAHAIDYVEAEKFLDALFDPGRELVAQHARLLFEKKTDEHDKYLQTLREWGILPAVIDLFDAMVGEMAIRHQIIRGRAVPESVSTRPYTFIRAASLRNQPRPGWLVDQVLMEGGFAVLYGQPNCGKSFVALDWALSIVHGCDWQGRPTVKGGGAVGYIAAEGSFGLGPRIQAWHEEHGCTEDDIIHEDFYLLGSAPFLMKHETASRLAIATWTIKDLKLIVIDTMARTMVGGDENSAEDMGQYIDNIEMLRNATDAAILIVHHTTKVDGSNVFRGSSALSGAATTMLLLKAEKSGAMTLVCTKQKEAALFDPDISLQRTTVSIGDDEGLSCIIEAGHPLFPPADNQVIALRTLDSAGRELSTTEWLKAAGIPSSTFDVAIKALREGEFVVKAAKHRGKYTMTAKGKERLAALPVVTVVPVPVIDLTIGSD
jgi:predicted transcriptional regulator